MQIVLYPDPILRKKAERISDPGDDWVKTGQEMLKLMYETGGVGLAAPQVGISKSILVLNPAGDPQEKDQELILLNPEIVRRKGKEWGMEGCLSFPGVQGEVQRAVKILVRAMTPEGEEIEFPASEFLARVIQHEMDHLNGIVFIDRFSPADRIKMKIPIEELEARFARRQRESGSEPTGS
ncbi:MAG: peptide deformylase [Planctomycetota bacterium]|nr:MAG: peptide deformylase [Planctomycetota bacterium]